MSVTYIESAKNNFKINTRAFTGWLGKHKVEAASNALTAALLGAGAAAMIMPRMTGIAMGTFLQGATLTAVVGAVVKAETERTQEEQPETGLCDKSVKERMREKACTAARSRGHLHGLALASGVLQGSLAFGIRLLHLHDPAVVVGLPVVTLAALTGVGVITKYIVETGSEKREKSASVGYREGFVESMAGMAGLAAATVLANYAGKALGNLLSGECQNFTPPAPRSTV